MRACFFIGHRDAPEEIYPLILHAIRIHITEYGVNRFIVGRYGAFDRLAAKAVTALKKEHPGVRLSLLLPYHPSERKTEKTCGFDDTIYPDGLENVPRRYAIVQANKRMINRTEYLIAYAWQPGSNSVRLLEYAAERKIKVLNLYSEDNERKASKK